jgi:hypothetical protein
MMARVAMAAPILAAGEGFAGIADDSSGTCLQATVRQQYVGGDHDAARRCLLRNPVIRRIETRPIRYAA